MAGGLIVGSVFAVVRVADRARAQGLDQGQLQELKERVKWRASIGTDQN